MPGGGRGLEREGSMGGHQLICINVHLGWLAHTHTQNRSRGNGVYSNQMHALPLSFLYSSHFHSCTLTLIVVWYVLLNFYDNWKTSVIKQIFRKFMVSCWYIDYLHVECPVRCSNFRCWMLFWLLAALKPVSCHCGWLCQGEESQQLARYGQKIVLNPIASIIGVQTVQSHRDSICPHGSYYTNK